MPAAAKASARAMRRGALALDPAPWVRTRLWPSGASGVCRNPHTGTSSCTTLRPDAVIAGLLPDMAEYFIATGGPSLPECLRKMSEPDVILAVAARRHGWVRPDQPADWKTPSFRRLQFL
jgi:hypothetical protein